MVIVRVRSPALITTSAVITLVMLPIGRSVFSSRLHRTVPVDPSAIAAALACTPLGALDLAVPALAVPALAVPALADAAWADAARAGTALAGAAVWARLGGADTSRARPAARLAAGGRRGGRG